MLLRITYDEDVKLCAVLDKHEVSAYFVEEWGISQGSKFDFLRAVCGSMVTSFTKQRDVLDTLTQRMAHA
ncbi:unnamed protein product [Hyaloperonospora brassicae]|uniref:Spindle assembly checkpoint component MAD1 n=1 Tax=Hyaloperonospora brassicae TaxID=162125 RepID=A0AAV0U4K9_HYABA|nr:unnamed protein product [Hyaloperonospora brassicae]